MKKNKATIRGLKVKILYCEQRIANINIALRAANEMTVVQEKKIQGLLKAEQNKLKDYRRELSQLITH